MCEGSVDVAAGTPARVVVDGVPCVVARLGDGLVAAVDRCPHRGAPLSEGTIEGGELVCPYHGWRFGPDGRVREIPALGTGAALPPKARLAMVAMVEGTPAPAAGPEAVVVPAGLGNDDPGLRRGWHPVCRSDEVVAGGALAARLLGGEVILRRDAGGVVAADGVAAVADHLGHVWVALDSPVAGLIEVPELDEPGWRHVPMPRIEGRYGVGLLLDNQLDAGHFSFVHRGTFGSGASGAIPPYELTRSEWGFETTYAVPISGRNDAGVQDGRRPLDQHRTMTYRYQAPAALWLRLDYHEMGGSTGIIFCLTPLEGDRARMDVDLYFRRPGGFTDEELAERLAFEIKVVAEDMALQDSFPTTVLPLAPGAEVHTRVDKAAVEMRRILQRFLAAAAA